MKKAFLFVSVVVIFIGYISCNDQGNKKVFAKEISTSDIGIYYFHFTRRCATCMAVEENALKAVEALYPNEIKSGNYSFISLNLDETAAKVIADKLGVGGQTMLVVHGEKKIDITSAVWMVAHDPDKMKVEIKSGIDKVLF
jgi:hypothetical protein